MKALFFTFFAACSFIAASAQDVDRVTELEQRVKKLEERLAIMENRATTPEAKMMKKAARERDASDRKSFKKEDITHAEEMYQRAARILKDSASKLMLDSVVLLYPQLNGAGCAQLYRTQQEKGQEKERLLKDCMERFSGCYYFDGAQVGSLAMFQLAFFYKESGKVQESRKLFRQLRKENPDAIGHDGEPLADKIE